MTNPFKRKQYTPNALTENVLDVRTPGPFSYHLGDVFTPGASGWARAMGPNELLLQSIYGRGGVASVCCRKYSFDWRAQQAGNVPTVTLQNVSQGGVLVGTFGLTSLIQDRSANL